MEREREWFTGDVVVRDGRIADLVALQAAMLDRAVALTRPGGRIVFCTCSLLPEEGEAHVAAALARHPGLRLDLPDDIPGLDPAWRKPEGLRLRPDFWPESGGMDLAPDSREAGPGGPAPRR